MRASLEFRACFEFRASSFGFHVPLPSTPPQSARAELLLTELKDEELLKLVALDINASMKETRSMYYEYRTRVKKSIFEKSAP
jgi:hypothetical protein